MRLRDLNPAFLGAGGEGVSQPGPDPCGACQGSGCATCHHTGKTYVPAPRRDGVGVAFDCPCGCDSCCYVEFRNPLDGGPKLSPEPHPSWQREGETFETLTLSPSIQRVGGCGWHGFIRSGAIETV